MTFLPTLIHNLIKWYITKSKTVRLYWKEQPNTGEWIYFWTHIALEPYHEEFHKKKPFWVGHSNGYGDKIVYGDIIEKWSYFEVEFDVYRKVRMDGRDWWAFEFDLSITEPDKKLFIESVKQSTMKDIELFEDGYQDYHPNLYLIMGLDDIVMANGIRYDPFN